MTTAYCKCTFLSLLDGNHKLIRWGLVIHGAIDGFSRLIVFLRCSDNNRASTVMQNFTEAVRKYGLPSRIRCDQGGENYGVAELMLKYRGVDRNSVLVGPSVHNQRIERLWRDVFDAVIQLYYRLFYFMERCDILDPLNTLHLFCLHFVFIPKINKALVGFTDGWNSHPMSGCNGKSPFQMFFEGVRSLQTQNIIAQDFLSEVDSLYGDNDEDEVNASTRPKHVNVPKIPNPLSVADFEQLQAQYNPTEFESNDHGIDLYQKVLTMVSHMH